MGGGTSTLNRVRNSLVIRAYNTRERNMTVREQFASFCDDSKNGKVLTLNKIKECLQLEGSCEWLHQLLLAISPDKV